MTTIFEIVDATDEETYWPMGLFLTLSDAVTAMNGGPEAFGNLQRREECMVLEIRERKLGWQPLEVGKQVASRTWNLVWPEDGSDPRWEEAK